MENTLKSQIHLDPNDGRPLLEHRPVQNAVILGGGLWVVKSTVILDMFPFLTGKPFASHFDNYAAISGGAIITSAALLPRHIGSSEPMHHDFRTIRPQLIEDSKEIFPKKKHQSFFARRIKREAALAISTISIYKARDLQNKYLGALQGISDLFDPLRIKDEGSQITDQTKLTTKAKYAARAGLRAAFGYVTECQTP